MPTTTPRSADTPASALAVYAHPDDGEISAGGTLARWAQEGAQVWVLITARGDKGTTDPDADLEALVSQRLDETDAAATRLGFSGHFHLDYPDGALPDDHELSERITRFVRELRPEVVLCPDPTAVFLGDSYVNHRDHRVTGWAVLDAVSTAASNPHYFPEHLADGLGVHQVRAAYLSGTLEPNCWVDVSETIEAKIDALFLHRSQLTETGGEAGEWFRSFLRAGAEDAGREAGLAYAEAYRRITFSS